MNLLKVAKLTEDEARSLWEEIRWPEGPVCVHCGGLDRIYSLKNSQSARPGLYECGDCKKQFTVTVGTVMHRSRIPLRKWVVAFYSVCSHKKGVSALQLQRDLGLGSYNTAWYMLHRIRLALKEGHFASLKGTVEADETYIGGRTREGIRGRGSERKTPVMALVERKGRVKAKPVERVDARTLQAEVLRYVHPSARIMTDEWLAYRGIGRWFEQGHQVVHHGLGEYVKGGVSTNTAESFFALLKRGVHGTFHSVSRKHLGRYCDEFSFRWNTRYVSDGERMREAIRGSDGKRLRYRDLVA